MAIIERYKFTLDMTINGYADKPVVLDVGYTYHDPLPETDVDEPEPAKVDILYVQWVINKVRLYFPTDLINHVAPQVWDEIRDEIIAKKQGIG